MIRWAAVFAWTVAVVVAQGHTTTRQLVLAGLRSARTSYFNASYSFEVVEERTPSLDREIQKRLRAAHSTGFRWLIREYACSVTVQGECEAYYWNSERTSPSISQGTGTVGRARCVTDGKRTEYLQYGKEVTMTRPDGRQQRVTSDGAAVIVPGVSPAHFAAFWRVDPRKLGWCIGGQPLDLYLQDRRIVRRWHVVGEERLQRVQAIHIRAYLEPSSSEARLDIWLDPQHRYMIRRMTFLRHGRESSEQVVSEISTRLGLVLPKRIHSVWRLDAAARCNKTGTAEFACTVVLAGVHEEAAVRSSSFHVSMPPGTVVSDKVSNSKYYVDSMGQRQSAASFPADQMFQWPGGRVISFSIGTAFCSLAYFLRQRGTRR